MKRMGTAITALLFVIVIAQYGNLIYMNLRTADPILPGWEEFDQNAFDRYQASGETVMVEIYASWCPTCKAQHESLTILDENGVRPPLRAIRVDFDRDAKFRERIGITYTGAMLAFKGGKIISQANGLVTPEALKGFMDKVTVQR